MSENKKYSLTEYVFRDIRIDDKCRKNSYKQRIKEALNDGDPIDKVKEYHRILVDEYKNKKQESEHWSRALESYFSYPCFENDYNEKKGFLYYDDIKITADILTGPGRIIKIMEELGTENKEIVETVKRFCSVAYTVGNCCPVMKNPHGSDKEDIKDWEDTCWWKFNHCLELKKEYDDIKTAKWNPDLNWRKPDDMFAVFPDSIKGRKIRDRLMLMDYYNGDRLIVDPITQGKSEEKAQYIERFINLVNLYTLLIIKRGIRIYYMNDLSDIKDLDELATKLIEDHFSTTGT